ncbi:peptidoglycan-binding domain-containing protein [Yinghuangia seranimata]|uniref:peptidoglycan-binding domain-containing protein n=1 Tax=Yinghuangia seranimata TaxID=408067 RepID=UPI00248D1189|nr:peptidoglycan-binding domain-containing protein [Yinghuangia seranimata]MDI2129917.1 peptidoglycan-binding domain-containing protein [Yinghuangia seranimata]
MPTSPPASAPPPPTTAATPGRTTATARPTRPASLRAGSTGPEVTDLQRLLIALGKTYVDDIGRYDSRTTRAVTELQQEYGVEGDPPGVYGPATRAALGGG